jgi:nitrite reductase (NADH) small subunit
MSSDTIDLPTERVDQWTPICPVEIIPVGCGVCALVGGRQVAIVRLADGRVFAIDNFDPFSRAFVISRGLVGTKGATAKIASPIYKQTFDLETGICLDKPEVRIPTYPCRVERGIVHLAIA